MIYADTSFLVSVFVPDGHTPKARATLAGEKRPLVYNQLLGLEIENALWLCVFRGTLPEPEALRALAKVGEFLDRGILITCATGFAGVLNRAKTLSRRAAGQYGCRSLDLIHVALALELGVKVMWSFDTRQRMVAEHAGLEVNG